MSLLEFVIHLERDSSGLRPPKQIPPDKDPQKKTPRQRPQDKDPKTKTRLDRDPYPGTDI